MTKNRTSKGYRTSVLARLAHLVKNGDHVGAEAFLRSDLFVNSLPLMSDYDRGVTMVCVHNFMRPVWPPLPAPRSVRAKWSEEQVARLRGIAARFGLRPGLDQELARKMDLPLMAVTLARYRYVGRVRAPHSTRTIRVRGFHEPRGPRRPPVHLQA